MLHDFERHLCIEYINKFNQNNLQSNERFADPLDPCCSDKCIGEPKIRNILKEPQIFSNIVVAVMSEHNVDWSELAVGVFEKGIEVCMIQIVKEQHKRQRSLYYCGFTYE